MSIKKRFQQKWQSQQSQEKTNICKICFNPIKDVTIQNLFRRDLCVCQKCLKEMSPVLNKFKIDGISGINVYFYNEKIRNLLYQFKGCNDYELKDTFLNHFIEYVRSTYPGYILVPAPSSEEAVKERGFLQVESMFESTKLKMVTCFHKNSNVKQHDLKAEERANIINSISLDNIDFKGKKLLIVDDVFTTGSTIRAMIALLKPLKPKKIKILVMSKTLDDINDNY